MSTRSLQARFQPALPTSPVYEMKERTSLQEKENEHTFLTRNATTMLGGNNHLSSVGLGLDPKAAADMVHSSPLPLSTRKSTTIFWDWDDTLFPSSWIAHHNHRLDIPPNVTALEQAYLDQLEISILALLTFCKSYGTCIIITNAEQGWVELSCGRFLPRLVKELVHFKIVSARSNYEHLYPDAPTLWKSAAFTTELDLLRYHPTKDIETFVSFDDKHQVISIGDSLHERDALFDVTASMTTTVWTKSVKLVERPSLDQLLRQLGMLRRHFSYILTATRPLDLMLTRERATTPFYPLPHLMVTGNLCFATTTDALSGELLPYAHPSAAQQQRAILEEYHVRVAQQSMQL